MYDIGVQHLVPYRAAGASNIGLHSDRLYLIHWANEWISQVYQSGIKLHQDYYFAMLYPRQFTRILNMASDWFAP